MTAPSIKEALERARKWLVINDDPRCQQDLVAVEAALATLQPSGERLEAIARRLKSRIGSGRTVTVGPGLYEDISEAADALASGLVQDEAAIRADEREKCAKEIDARAEEIALKQREQNPLGTSYLREAKNYREASAAIRSARNGGGS